MAYKAADNQIIIISYITTGYDLATAAQRQIYHRYVPPLRLKNPVFIRKSYRLHVWNCLAHSSTAWGTIQPCLWQLRTFVRDHYKRNVSSLLVLCIVPNDEERTVLQKNALLRTADTTTNTWLTKPYSAVSQNVIGCIVQETGPAATAFLFAFLLLNIYCFIFFIFIIIIFSFSAYCPGFFFSRTTSTEHAKACVAWPND